MDTYGPWWQPEQPLYGAPAQPPRQSKSGLVALLVAAGVFGAGVGHYLWSSASPAPGASLGIASGSAPNAGLDPASLAARVDPALVDVDTSDGYQGVLAAGTGMVLTSTGEVLTNNHVIEGATAITVVDVGNRHSYHAHVVGYSRSGDIALLQLIGASGLPTVSLGNSNRVRAGEAVLALGNAGGSGGRPSYAAGTITALHQAISATDQGGGVTERLTGLLETDADVVPGDSGGPLVDASGAVVGMDTAASANFAAANSAAAGFAVPINAALRVVREIRQGTGAPTVHVGATAFLGVSVQNAPGSGALVAGVVSGGPAEQAGITAGDVIVSLAGHAVSSAAALTTLVLAQRPGARVRVGFLGTDGAAHSVSVVLAAGPPQ
ncbi:MAG: S1C family serine protease [Mycobacteriales bacterium]